MNIQVNSIQAGAAPRTTAPTKSVASNDGWSPVIDDAVVCSKTPKGEWDCDEVRAIFAQMGNDHQNRKAGRHETVMGAQQEVRRINDEAAAASRETQARMSDMARQSSFGSMGGGFGSFPSGGLGYSGYYGATGVNTGVNTGQAGSMLNNSYMMNGNMDDPNYLRTLTDSDIQRMGLDPMMVRMYCNNPQMYPGGLRSMMTTNGTFMR